MYFVYAISSTIRSYIYVGLTSNLEQRIQAHNSDYERTTRPYKPFILIYTEAFETRELARQKEKYLKSGKGKDFLKSLKVK